ncbi:MAG: tetratricopeptide repeat protein, partial [Acidobacteriota bacterium]|nr:tetratricopeptide repeat protein [Acidobacteriota bacterium]
LRDGPRTSMAELSPEARIRDLKRRLELDPSSRLFVTLAEEYRKTGRLADALSTLQKGLLAHPGYISAQVALGRAYLEAGQITEAIATFSKVLASDPGNLVSAKSLADVYLSRGESLEAVKKYKLYRALSGDRKVDEIIERLQVNLVPPPPVRPDPIAVPPPPMFSSGKVTGPVRTSREIPVPEPAKSARAETAEVSSLPFDFEETTRTRRRELEPFPVLSRDTAAPMSSEASAAPSLSSPPAAAFPAAAAASDDVATRALRVADVFASGPPASTETLPGVSAQTPASSAMREDRPAPAPAPQTAQAAQNAEPHGRTLADLYFAQGHYAEALRIYDEIVAANGSDPELARMRRDAEARLLPASTTRASTETDSRLTHRLARIRALKRWLSVVQTG